MLKTVSSIANAIGALNYKGTWNAATNTPALTTATDILKGDYYVISVGGTTTLGGISLWGVGDWVVYNGSEWQRVEGGDTGEFVTVTASEYKLIPTGTATGNGVYLPATNTLALSTDGAERVRVTSAGNVGIGTTSPTFQLQTSADASFHGVRVGRGGGDRSLNTAVGASALNTNTTGEQNTAIGGEALSTNTISGSNTAVGFRALQNNTGARNTSVGRNALRFNTTGNGNSAVGQSALANNTTGNNNVTAGEDSLSANTTGNNNAVVGTLALLNNTTGSNNTAVGREAGRYFGASTDALTNPTSSVFVGFLSRASADNTTNEIVIGHNAIGEGSNSVSIGNSSITKTILRGNLLLGTTTDNGVDRLQVSGSVLATADASFNGVRVGRGAGNIISNTAAGSLALNANTTGSSNTAIGRFALSNNETGNLNTAVGTQALENSTASNNTAVGVQALQNNTASENTAVGRIALRSNTTGSGNCAVGDSALTNNTTGNNNTVVGSSSMPANTTGGSNAALGNFALLSTTTGSNNLAVGTNAGRFFGAGTDALTVSSNSVFVGASSRAGADNTTNEIVIGHNAIGAGSNTATLGNTSITQTVLRGAVNAGTSLAEAGTLLTDKYGRLAASNTWTAQQIIRNSAVGDPLLLARDINAGESTNFVSLRVGNSGSGQGNGAIQYQNAAAAGSPLFRMSFQPRNNDDTTAIAPASLTFTKTAGADTAVVDLRVGSVGLRIGTTGNALIGTGTDNGTDNLQVAGSIRATNGIRFVDAGSLLSAYTEGTWTPTLVGTTTPGTHTYTTQTGRYTRIGRMVFATCLIQISSKDAAMAGDIRVSGLPFAVIGTLSSPGCISQANGVTFADQLMIDALAGTTQIRLRQQPSGGNASNIAAADLGATPLLLFHVTYEV